MLKYKEGDKIGPYNVLFLRELEKEPKSTGRRGIFLCECGKEFESDVAQVGTGKRRYCQDCKYKYDTRVKWQPGMYVGKNHNILLLERLPKEGNVRLKCPVCGKEDWVVDNGSIFRISRCYDCYKKERVQQFQDNKKYSEGDSIGPNKIRFIKYTQTGYRVRSLGLFICPICQKEFEYRIDEIVDGRVSCCRNCSFKSSGEELVKSILENNHIDYVREKVFPDCIFPKTGGYLRFDFYLPEYNCCIEYDGEQHFHSVSSFGGEEAFLQRVERDKFKDNYCRLKNISLLRIPYSDTIDIVKEKINSFLKTI